MLNLKYNFIEKCLEMNTYQCFCGYMNVGTHNKINELSMLKNLTYNLFVTRN